MDILEYTENLEFYVAREWNGWLSGWQIVQIFNAAQDKFGCDDKKVRAFGTKHIVKGIEGELKDIEKLGLTDKELIEVLDNETNKTIARMLRN